MSRWLVAGLIVTAVGFGVLGSVFEHALDEPKTTTVRVQAPQSARAQFATPPCAPRFTRQAWDRPCEPVK